MSYNKIENMDPLWDDDQMWDDIEKELNKKKKRRFLYIPFGIFSLIGVVYILSVFFISDDKVAESINNKADTIQTISTTEIVPNNLDENIKNETNNSNSNSQLENENKLKPITQSESQVEDNEEGNNNYSNQFEIEVTKKNGSVIRKKYSESDVSISSLSIYQKSSSNIQINNVEIGTSRIQQDSLKEAQVNNVSLPSMASIEAMPFVLFKLKPRPKLLSRRLGMVFTYSKFNHHVHKLPSRLNLGIGAGLISNDKIVFNQWSDNMSQVEKPLYSLEAELSYLHSLKIGFFVEAGLNVRQQSFKMNAMDTSITQEVALIDTFIIVTNGLQELVISGEGIKTTSTFTEYEVYNKYNHISIPIRVGYRHRYHKSDFTVKAGLRIASLQSSNGYAINTSHKILPQSDFDLPKFVGLSAIDVSMYYGREITNGLSINLGIQYQQQLNTKNQLRRNNTTTVKLSLSKDL